MKCVCVCVCVCICTSVSNDIYVASMELFFVVKCPEVHSINVPLLSLILGKKRKPSSFMNTGNFEQTAMLNIAISNAKYHP